MCEDADADGARHRPFRVDALPEAVVAEDLYPDAKASGPGHLWSLIGVGGDDVVPVGVDLSQDARTFVAGPPKSGRSTTLCTMAAWLSHQGVATLLVAGPRSPLRGLSALPGVLGCLDHTVFDPARLLESAVPLVVFADDAERLADTAVERSLLSLLTSAAGVGQVSLVLAGTTAELAVAFRGLTVEALRSRCGLLLGRRSPSDCDLFGLRLGGGSRMPGQGMLVLPGGELQVQVAGLGHADSAASGWIHP